MEALHVPEKLVEVVHDSAGGGMVLEIGYVRRGLVSLRNPASVLVICIPKSDGKSNSSESLTTTTKPCTAVIDVTRLRGDYPVEALVLCVRAEVFEPSVLLLQRRRAERLC